MTEFCHHSRMLRYRRPFGAATCGARVRIAADCAMPEGTRVWLRLWQEGRCETLVPMARAGDTVSVEVAMPDEPCLVWYFFVLHTREGQTLYYGGASGEGSFFKHEPPAFQITVHRASFATPASWRRGLCYQIFPDRFKRSSWEDFRSRAGYHASLGRQLRIHDRWNEEPATTAPAGQTEYAPNDFFGGDINGIREKLPYLKSLGVSYLYLNPVFESGSNHRYDTADYHRIDPILGTEDDFADFILEARDHGIGVILDGVFSHTGADSRYFNRDGRYPDRGAYQGKDSPYYEWYTFHTFPDVYDCWWNFPSLPNVAEMTPSYVEFVAGENGVLAHWLRLGVMGFRLDVADELPDPFIRILRRRVKEINPEAVLIGEVWEDCSNKFEGAHRRDYVDGDELDSAMNYPFARAVVAFLTGRTDAYALTDALGTLREHYPKPFFDAAMNLLTSHDDVRLLTQLAGAPDRRALTRAEQAVYKPSFEDLALAHYRAPLAFAIQAAHPGVPSVYYGDEAGMQGMADPFNRAPYPWGAEEPDILAAAGKLFSARARHTVLQTGLTRMGALSADVFSIVRYLPETEDCAVLLVNRSAAEQPARLASDTLREGPDAETDVPLAGRYTEVLTGEMLDIEGGLSVALMPLTAKLFIKGEFGCTSSSNRTGSASTN